ncbi:hypothetical protein ZIOFF_042974 [Zingiber officinale]|uniref:Uncharacterized protein n=1 Tax=Zingiber officinale TaxID=94328 RepID=A0A8J5FU56_ZINOF|nr:hypothetical protein ZIOFF_042974 [Zingiber officinale]
MLTLLAILCTIYLYFAITFGVAIDSCTSLSGAKKGVCQAKALEVKKFKPDQNLLHMVNPDTAEFISVVQALKGGLHPQREVEALLLNEAMTFLDREDVVQVEPYNALLKGLCNAGRYQEAAIYHYKMIKPLQNGY